MTDEDKKTGKKIICVIALAILVLLLFFDISSILFNAGFLSCVVWFVQWLNSDSMSVRLASVVSVSFLIFAPVAILYVWKVKKYREFWKFEPSTNFFSLNAVRVITILFIVIALFMSVDIYLFSMNVGLVSSALENNTYNQIWIAYKAPISLLISLLPILGLMAANHRSIISIKQIEETEKQNIFSNHYKHREEFVKHAHINCLKPAKELKLNIDKKINRLHAVIYKGTWSGGYKVDKDFMRKTERTNKLFHDKAIKIQNLPYTKAWLIVKDCADDVHNLAVSMGFSTAYLQSVCIRSEGATSANEVSGIFLEITKNLVSINELLLSLCSFDSFFIKPHRLSYFESCVDPSDLYLSGGNLTLIVEDVFPGYKTLDEGDYFDAVYLKSKIHGDIV